MVSASLFSFALLASTAVAVPSRLANRVTRRRENAHRSSPLKVIESSISNTTHEEYSSNWAGAVLVADSATYTSVTGTFTVPTPSSPNGDSGSYSASAWVGIDGDTCGNAILQTGVDFSIDGGSVSYDAWYEWYPDYAYDFSGISFNAGDQVQLTVSATSESEGSATIENLSTGQTVTQSLSSSSSLCEYNAEWIVEDYEEGSSLVSFANFGTVTFSGASAGTNSGSVGPSGATIIDIDQNNQVLTSSSVGDDSVTVQYVG